MTEEMLKAIRFYEGDLTGLNRQDPFWGDAKAYTTLNSLLFPGTENEKARAREGKKLNPAALQDLPRLLSLYLALFQAFRENRAEEEYLVFRVERYSDYLSLKEAGAAISFTSTSTAGFLSAYQDKKGLALMKIRIPAGTPCLDLSKVLPSYQKAEEAEILLPPFTRLLFREVPLSEEEKRILDADGRPPMVSAEVTISEEGSLGTADPFTISLNGCSSPEDPLTGLLNSLPPDGPEAGRRMYTALNQGAEPEKKDLERFAAWKKEFQHLLKKVSKLGR